MLDLPMKHRVGRQANGIEKALLVQVLV